MLKTIAHLVFFCAFLIFFATISPTHVIAQTVNQPKEPFAEVLNNNPETATAGAIITPTEDATPSSLASRSAEINEKLTQIKQQDITEVTGTQKSALAAYLDQNPVSELSWWNFLQHGLRGAIARGLPANIIVLILLFPVITSIIAASRHIIGLKGFGIYTPAVLAVAFVSTGILTGIVFFVIVLLAAMLFRWLVKKLELQYLPRTAMLLWGVSLTTLGFLIASVYLDIDLFLSISIFPLLIIMLLTENFMETQLASSQSQAIQLTVETLVIAIVCSLFIDLEFVQKWVIINPELTILVVAGFNILIGRYTGLRLLEYIRFRPLLNE